MDQFDIGGQQFIEAKPKDRVRVTATDFHQPEVTPRISQATDFLERIADDLRVAKLVDVFHGIRLSSAGEGVLRQTAALAGSAPFVIGQFRRSANFFAGVLRFAQFFQHR